MKIFVIADSDTYLAFSLAGMRGQVAHSEAEVCLILEKIDPAETGLILITELLAEKARKAIDRILAEPGCPLILEIPDFGGPLIGRASVTERIVSLLRR